MPYLTHHTGTRIYYQDLGDGPAVLLLSAWSLNSTMWEYQVPDLVEAGHRVVALDRRGHGRSDDPGVGYDLDTLADDLAALIDHLDLNDLTVVGHSMGGTEITRYVTRHGDRRVSRAVFLAPVTPWLRGAVGAEAYEAALRAMRADRPHWFASAIDGYFASPGSGVSAALAQDTLATCLGVPMEVLVACQRAGSGDDTTAELAAVNVPVLVVHGDADESAPLEITGRPTAALIPHGRLLVYPGAPHGLYVTHRDRLNKDLLAFLAG
jgi:pimeloyl-ACP methyl ester carboxylesterase